MVRLHHFLAQLHMARVAVMWGFFSHGEAQAHLTVRPVDARHDERDVAQRDFKLIGSSLNDAGFS